LIPFSAFICHLNFRSNILELIITKYPRTVVRFLSAFNITRDMKIFVQISTIFALFNKIKSERNISGKINSTKTADHILEMPGLGEYIILSKIIK